jgi:transposase-like protein
MGKFKFNEETIEKLRRNKYVIKATESSVQFTDEFKAKIIHESSLGKSYKKVLSETGIDPEALGSARMRSLFMRVRQQAKRPGGFERVKSPGRPKKLTFSSLEEENRYLKDKNEYLEQENEFLKKLKALERGE